MADSLPGLGIVAAVLGAVITMGALGGPPEQIGHKVAAALVGTFLGILLCYGLVGPVAANMAKAADEEHAFYNVLRVVMLALKGTSPIMAVEIGRRAPGPCAALFPGHTDTKPFARDSNYGNWELSVDRANAARRLMQQNGVKEDQVAQVRGYADQQLHKPNNNEDPSNRRISLIIQYIVKDQSGGRKLTSKRETSKARSPRVRKSKKRLVSHDALSRFHDLKIVCDGKSSGNALGADAGGILVPLVVDDSF
jgi:OmpA family